MPSTAEHVPGAHADAPRRTSRTVDAWASGMTRQDRPTELLALAERCTDLSLGVSFAVDKVLVFRIHTPVGIINPIGVDPEYGVLIPWAVGPYKKASRTFAYAMAAVIPEGVAYETSKAWAVRRTLPDGKRVRASPVHLLAVEEQLRAALQRFSHDVNRPSLA